MEWNPSQKNRNKPVYFKTILKLLDIFFDKIGL